MERKRKNFGLVFYILLLHWEMPNTVDAENGDCDMRLPKDILNQLCISYYADQDTDEQSNTLSNNSPSFYDSSRADTSASEVHGSDYVNGDVSPQTKVRSKHHPNGHPPHIQPIINNGGSSSDMIPLFYGGTSSGTSPSEVNGSDHDKGNVSPQTKVRSKHHPNGHPPHIQPIINNGGSSSDMIPPNYGDSSSETSQSEVNGSDYDKGDVSPQTKVRSKHQLNGRPPYIQPTNDIEPKREMGQSKKTVPEGGSIMQGMLKLLQKALEH